MRRMIKRLWGPLTTLFPRARSLCIHATDRLCARQIIIKKSPECLVLMQISRFLLLSPTGSHLYTAQRCTMHSAVPRSNYCYCCVAQQVGMLIAVYALFVNEGQPSGEIKMRCIEDRAAGTKVKWSAELRYYKNLKTRLCQKFRDKFLRIYQISCHKSGS
jgi:hypothetical protein